MVMYMCSCVNCSALLLALVHLTLINVTVTLVNYSVRAQRAAGVVIGVCVGLCGCVGVGECERTRHFHGLL